MKLNAEQQTWLDKLKETWSDIEFYEDERKEYCISFGIDHDFYAFHVKESFAIWKFRIFEAPNLTKTMLNKMLSFFEKIAKSEGKILFLEESHLNWRINKAKDFLEKKNYEEIKGEHNLHYLFNAWDFKNLYMKKDNKKSFESYMNYASSFNDAVEHMMERVAGMEMMEDNRSHLEFLYLDHPFSIELLYQSSQVIVEIIDLKTNKAIQHVIQKPDDMMDIILNEFKEKREKQKIRRLFNRNDRYYSVMVHCAFNLSKEDVLYETLYQHLRKWYHPMEIEELAFEYQEEYDLPTRQIAPFSFVFKLKDKWFYIDFEEKTIKSMDSGENNHEFSEMIFKKTKEKIEQSLQELDIL